MTVIGHGDDDVGSATAGGFVEFINLFCSLFGSAGPGVDGARTYARPADERGFTFEPQGRSLHARVEPACVEAAGDPSRVRPAFVAGTARRWHPVPLRATT